MKKLYIGNLAYEVTEDDIRDLFADFGDVVSVSIITDRYSGKSKGFGFVEFKTAEAAKEAISKMNETEVKGRKIVVDEARPKKSNDRGR